MLMCAGCSANTGVNKPTQVNNPPLNLQTAYHGSDLTALLGLRPSSHLYLLLPPLEKVGPLNGSRVDKAAGGSVRMASGPARPLHVMPRAF